jgi:enoyl-CoA hydratase
LNFPPHFMHCRAVSTPTEEALVVLREPPLAWCIVNRPAAHNAMNAEVWRGLAEQVEALGRDSDVRVIILRGAGEQAFISGADITEFRALRNNAAMTAEYDQLSARAWLALNRAPQPVIAMLNGLCFGGGVAVAVACDLRFAADHARFAVPAARLGLAYPLPAVERLLQVVGPTHAADILLSTRAFDAAEAERMGFVNRVVARAELEDRTRKYALAMAECAPLTLAAHKLAIQQCLLPAERRDIAALHEAAQRCFDSADYQEGIAAFLEKRKPKFSGK